MGERFQFIFMLMLIENKTSRFFDYMIEMKLLHSVC